MDENTFWSSSLGQWISECVCSTSSSSSSSSSKQNPPPLGPLIAETSWRSASNLELQPRYSELCDGVALNLIFSHLSNNNNDQSPAKRLFLFQPSSSGSGGLNVERSESLSSGVSSVTATVLGHGLAARLRQFQHLIEGLCRFYRSKSLLVLSVPDVLCIARSPLPEVSGHEMHKLLALLLGAAVQSPQREHFIDRIKRMRPEVQSELAEEIQRVTNGTANAPVINLDSLMAELESARAEGTGEAAESQQQRIVALIERVVREREEFTSGLLEMAQEMEQDDTGPSSGLTTASSSCNGDALPTKSSNAGGRSPSPSAMDRHMSVELAAAKAEMRKLRNENEEKEEMLLELQDELEKQRAEIGRLQAERLELVKDARAAKDYKDEMDCMHHKLTRLERLEAENEKLRGRIGEMDFYKNRVNHLKEDNKIMQETYRVMEEQLEQYQRKLSAQLEVESKLIEAQASTKSLQLDMTKTRERVEELLLENGRLERDLRLSRQKCAELEREMHSITEFASPRLELSNGGGLNESSLLAQLEAHSQSQILELQLENRKLKAQLESKECTNPAELFELRAELASAEKRAQDKVEECAILGTEWERTKKVAEENAERAQKLQSISEQMERQLAELRRASVPLKTHQKAVERLEQMEQKAGHFPPVIRTLQSQQLELHSRVEKEQLELIRAEKQEVEAQLSRMCGQQKESRADMDSLREQIKSEQAVWERQKKALEAERAMLKGRLDAAEARAQLKTNSQSEYMEQRVVELERQLAEGDTRAERLEAELGQARQQLDTEMRKGQRCREELAMERDRLRDLLARLRSVCLMAIRSGSDESEKCCLEPSSLDDDLQLIAIIDDLLLKALSSARREADALRIQQQKQIRELDDLKRDIQNLRRTGHELNASDDKLLLENRNIKEQVNLLQERLHRAQSEESARAAELQAAKREIEELQQKAFSHSRQNAELASLQLCLRSQRKQEVQLRQELGSSNVQLEAALKSHAETQKRLDSLELIHSALASDHDRLQNLHQILSSDYDRVKREKETLRQKLKGEKSTAEQLLRADFVRERDQLEQQLEAERMERHRESRRMAELQAELAKKNRELAELKKEQTTAMSRSDDCSDELRRLRMAECAHKATINNLNVIVQQLNNALTEKDLELANLRRQVEMFRQYSGDENKTLIRQIELLLIQNQQLHNRSDVFYAEQRELQEKLLTLRRHKEKLEEKIMEQYKTMDSRKLERPTFMKRAAKALIAKSPSRKSRPGKDANSMSDKSEESSIYSTENEMNGSNHPSTPVLSSPPPCPVPTRSAENDCIIGGGVSTAQNRPPGPGKVPSAASKPSTTAETQEKQQPTADAPEHLSLSRNGSAAGGSMYSSISHYQQNSIDSSAAAAAILSPLTRARNSRIGGSLRCAPMLARSFPSPAWQNASRDLLLMKEERSAAALPACCKVMQADTLPEMVNDGISSSTGRRPPLPAQPRILRELPPKVPVQHRPPPPPYPGANGLSAGKTGFSRASYRQGQPSSPTIFECPDPPSPQLVGGLPPRDMSTPKSLTAGSSVKFLSAAPSPIGFSRANSLACPKPGSSQATEALLIQPETAVERPERSPSVYENVADKGAGEDSNNNQQQQQQQQNHKSNASSIGERRGEKGEIWYELGCV